MTFPTPPTKTNEAPPPDALTMALDLELCKRSPVYFIDHFCQLYDGVSKDWIPFRLWHFQKEAITSLHNDQYHIWLKARQVGASWMGIAYGLWLMLFRPIAPGLYFSLRSTEAEDLISFNKMRGIYDHLPSWLIDHTRTQTTIDNVTYWQLANGSSARAFAANTGDSYTAAYAMLDEADLMTDLSDTLRRVRPTIEAGGKLLLLSRINKREPKSYFRSLWNEAVLGKNDFRPRFFPWHVHPNRDTAWYERQKRSFIHLDELYEQYPATPEEALAMGYAGLIFPNFSKFENVSIDADYDPNYPVEWAVDVGYTNPTCILFAQWRPFKGMTDHLCIFDMVYVTQQLPRTIILEGLRRAYAPPERMIYDSAAPTFAAEFTAIRNERGLFCQIVASTKDVYENIKNARNYVGDENNPRLLQFHPRCEIAIDEFSRYHEKESLATRGGDPAPVTEDNHSVDAALYLMATKLYRIRAHD